MIDQASLTGEAATGRTNSFPDVRNTDKAAPRGGVGGRTDIVQALELGTRDRLVRFCEAVQLLSPVDAFIKPGE